MLNVSSDSIAKLNNLITFTKPRRVAIDERIGTDSSCLIEQLFQNNSCFLFSMYQNSTFYRQVFSSSQFSVSSYYDIKHDFVNASVVVIDDKFSYDLAVENLLNEQNDEFLKLKQQIDNAKIVVCIYRSGTFNDKEKYDFDIIIEVRPLISGVCSTLDGDLKVYGRDCVHLGCKYAYKSKKLQVYDC